ncbi:HD domain-containing phosphohydrolase [Paenibacillus sp. Z3-2]
MKTINLYTVALFITGVSALIYLIFNSNDIQFTGSISILILIILLDLFPVKLLSGDEYSGGIMGFLILLIAYGPETAIFGMYLSTIMYFLKSSHWKIHKLAFYRLFSTIGMYTICIFITHLLIVVLGDISIYIISAFGAMVFETVNILLISGIYATVTGAKFFEQIQFKIKEVIIPVLLCTAVVPHFMEELADHLVFETFHTAIFLFFIIFFSRSFLQQFQLRKRASEEFIRLCEFRQSRPFHGHGSRTGEIMEHVLDRVAYSGRKRNELIMTAILHDIGKTKISSHILTKRGALSLTEEKEYQSHTDEGAEIIFNIMGNKQIADWIRYHHERYDGKGFPYGLKGKKIPLESRIISLCNQLDHLMLEYSNDEYVIQSLQLLSGKVLDPLLVSYLDVSDIESIRSMLVYQREPEKYASEPEASTCDNGAFIGGTSLLKYSFNEGFLGDIPPTDMLDSISDLAIRSLQKGDAFFETLRSGGKSYEAHFYPENEQVTIVMTDITPAIIYREEMHRNIMSSYKDVIETLSNRKVDLCLIQEEIKEQLGTFIATLEVNSKADVALSRTFVAEHYADHSDAKRLMHIKLAVSEGVTNLIKHAERGKISLYRRNDILQVLITDNGSGIPLHELPKTILISGYSSKRSMGKGFALIHASSDHVALHTNTMGTSLLMEFLNTKDGEEV